MLASKVIRPASIVEPTCGVGNLLLEAVREFSDFQKICAVDINPQYVEIVRPKLKAFSPGLGTSVTLGDFFTLDWEKQLNQLPEPLLIIGNPPWVTSSELGALDGANLPKKLNIDGLRGMDALTGKSNFDISEWILLRLIELLDGREATLAMLCKTSVARKILKYAWNKSLGVECAACYAIDAKAEFGASVAACLLYCAFQPHGRCREAAVYPTLESAARMQQIGFREDRLVTDVESYERWKHLEGESIYQWRSGIKHDCARVMELERVEGGLRNGLGEVIQLEGGFLYPMLKSSEIANGRTTQPRRWMLVTQKTIASDTETIKETAPNTWAYLSEHGSLLDSRRSSIYRGRPRFSVFGVGPYSFAPWKVAISGFYKKLDFQLLGPSLGKPIVLDDTSYFVPCESEEEAILVASLLNSEPAHEFLNSLVFWDAKRPITIDLLCRLNLQAVARELGRESQLHEFASHWARFQSSSQLQLF